MARRDPIDGLGGHVVICNCNVKVKRIVEQLQADAAGDPLDVVLLVQDMALWEAHPEWHPAPGAGRFLAVAGCPTNEHDLDQAHISAARAAIILTDPEQGPLADARSTLVAIAIERQNPQVHTVMELSDSINRIHLASTEVNEIVCLGEITEKLIAQSCISPGVKNLFEHLLSAGAADAFCAVALPPRLRGLTYREAARSVITGAAAAIPCGYVQVAPDGTRRYVINPPAQQEPGRDTVLGAEDELLLLARLPLPSLEDL